MPTSSQFDNKLLRSPLWNKEWDNSIKDFVHGYSLKWELEVPSIIITKTLLLLLFSYDKNLQYKNLSRFSWHEHQIQGWILFKNNYLLFNKYLICDDLIHNWAHDTIIRHRAAIDNSKHLLHTVTAALCDFVLRSEGTIFTFFSNKAISIYIFSLQRSVTAEQWQA